MEKNLGLTLTKRAHLNPDLEGLVDVASGRRFTYAQANARCNKTTNALAEIGVKKGDRVGILAMNSIEFVESFYAIAKLGAVCVPLNWRLVADELAFILKDSGTTTLIYDQDFEDVVTELQGRGKDATGITQWIAIGEATAFSQAYEALQSKASDTEPPVVAGEDDHLFVMYTSGTTGLPKGVIHTHNTMLWALITMSPIIDMRTADRYLLLLPLFHVGALAPLASCVYAGVTGIIPRTFDPSETWKMIEREKITNMLAVPVMLNFMHQVPAKDEVDYSSLRWILSGAAPVPANLIAAYAEMKIDVHQVYGLTETAGPACVIVSEDARRHAGSTGKAFFHTSVRIVDGDDNDVAPGEVGEVLVAGPHIMEGYWNRPDATAEALRDGWLYTGDLASMDEEGFVTIQDRIKDMIISGGENVYPAEIENVILSHEGVKEVAVIGQPSEKWGETAFAVVVKASEDLDEAAVLKHCEGKLARFKMPRGVAFVDEIPRNPSGKALKRILREQFPGPARD